MTITFITGANKGIGFETARQFVELGHQVYLGARDTGRGTRAADELGATFVELDVTEDASVAAALATIGRAEGQLDILVHNAGISEVGVVDGPTALKVFDTNAVGMVRVTEAALPLLEKSPNPSVVTVSSSAGSFWATTNPDRPEYALPTPLYAASKSALTMLTVQYAKMQPNISFNALEPGYTRTDLTEAFGGGRSPVESAAVVVRMAIAGANGVTGTYQDETGNLPW